MDPLQVPGAVVWSTLAAIVASLIAAFWLLNRTVWKVNIKVDETECLSNRTKCQQHMNEQFGAIREGLVRLEAHSDFMVEQLGGKPEPRPSNGISRIGEGRTE